MKKPFGRVGQISRSRSATRGESRKNDRDRSRDDRDVRGFAERGERRRAEVRRQRPDARVEGLGRDLEAAVSDDILRGRHPVLEALKAGRPINKIVIAEAAEGGSLAEIIGKAKAAGVMIQTAPRASLTKVAGDGHQGVIAYVAPHAYAELEDIINRNTGQLPLVVLLDEVTDPHNLGAVLRTAEATGAQGVVIPKRRAVPLTGIVAKAAAGALEHVPVARVNNLVQSMERLKQMGYWIVGTAVDAAAGIHRGRLQRKHRARDRCRGQGTEPLGTGAVRLSRSSADARTVAEFECLRRGGGPAV